MIFKMYFFSGRDGKVIKVMKVPPRTLLEQLNGRKGQRSFKGGAADWA